MQNLSPVLKDLVLVGWSVLPEIKVSFKCPKLSTRHHKLVLNYNKPVKHTNGYIYAGMCLWFHPQNGFLMCSYGRIKIRQWLFKSSVNYTNAVNLFWTATVLAKIIVWGLEGLVVEIQYKQIKATVQLLRGLCFNSHAAAVKHTQRIRHGIYMQRQWQSVTGCWISLPTEPQYSD